MSRPAATDAAGAAARAGSDGAVALPLASVVVVTHDRPRPLAACLDALAGQDHPEFEVVVVDDGGTLPLGPVLVPFADRLEVVLLRQPHAGPAAGRNRGARRARGQILAFTDDDCRPEPGWLRVLAERCAASPGAGAGGHTFNALPESPWSEVAQLVVDLGYRSANADPLDARFFASNNLALPADGFEAIGGFDPAFTTAEDRDLCDRWRGSGRRLLEAPGAVVRHAHGLDLRSFWRVHEAYGRGAYRFHRARATRRGRRRLGSDWIDPDYYREVARVAGRGGRGVPLLGPRLALWQLANAWGFVRGWRESLNGGPASARTGG